MRSRVARRPFGHPTEPVSDPNAIRSLRQVAEQALSRTSGAPLIGGNSVSVLEDAAGNYPRWLDAIRSAQRLVYLENYIFEEDEVGSTFAAALIDRARAGVTVRLVRDWMGSRRGASRGFWRRLTAAGVDVRCFNPPRLDSPLGWVSRDHRKMIAVDGSVGFVAGLCISHLWQGDAARGVAPWRDTGLEIRGPAVAEIQAAFAQIWETIGAPLPEGELSRASELPAVGDIALRVVAGAPSTAGLFRTDQLLAAVARRSLWLSDAYFVGITPYVQALRAAARDGVDVRLLIPNATDLPMVRALSRAGYRSLLEAGVRIFEWNGSMLHAKTAVVDGRWSRVGSSNLNLASFLGNYELDVAVDDQGIAETMEAMYRRDLDNATEVVIARNKVARMAAEVPPRGARFKGKRGISGPRGSAAAAGALRVANAVGAAMTNHRVLGAAEARLLGASGLASALVGVLALLFPRVVTVPLFAVTLWIGLALCWRAMRLRRGRPKARASAARERGGSQTNK